MSGKPWCIFTSAGDLGNFRQWWSPEAAERWDLVSVFYGDDEEEYRALADISTVTLRRKGSKFQNLCDVLRSQPELLSGYSAVWVCDDDVVMTPAQTVAAFELFERLGLWVAQPAFDPLGKAPHPVTHSQHPVSDVRLVNFLEMTCPIFRTDKLLDFMSVYDPRLVGWGTDWWFCHHLDSQAHWRFAVMDCITVVNPLPAQRRGGQREILRLGSNAEREACWRMIQHEHALPEFEQRTLARLKF